MIREGTAARNLEALMPLFEAPYYERCMLVTDDKHPGDLISMGHIDYIIRRAVSLGADPIRAIKMGTFNAARYFGLKDRGAVMPGLRADLAVLEDLKDIRVAAVYKDGVLTAKEGVCLGAGKEKKRKYAAGEELRSGSREDTESAEKQPVAWKLHFQGCLTPSIWMRLPWRTWCWSKRGPWSGLFSLNPMNFSQRSVWCPGRILRDWHPASAWNRIL